MNVINNLCGGLDLEQDPYLSLDGINDTESPGNDSDGKSPADDKVGTPLLKLNQAPNPSGPPEITCTVSNNTTENKINGDNDDNNNNNKKCKLVALPVNDPPLKKSCLNDNNPNKLPLLASFEHQQYPQQYFCEHFSWCQCQ